MRRSVKRREPTRIDAIAEQWVDTLVDMQPTIGTYIGRDHGSARYPDYSPEGLEQQAEQIRRTSLELEREDPADDVDRVTKADLGRDLELSAQLLTSGYPFRDLNNIESPVQEIREVFDLMPRRSEQDWSNVNERLAHVSEALAGYRQTLTRGIQTGNTPARRQVAEVLSQVARFAASDGFFADLGNQAQDQPLPASLRSELARNAASAAVAFDEFGAFLHDSLRPAATTQDAVGRDYYALLSRSFLGAEVDLEETYAWGLDELARMVEEQENAAKQILPGASVDDAIAFLEKDPARKLHGTTALREWMQATSNQTIADLGAHFDIPDPVRTIECMIAPTQEGGIYYTGPTDDFSRPGRMWWSVPEGATEFDTWRERTTVYHEGVPGHHLQIGQAVYNRATLNSWRRLLAGSSGHAEGWALYAERLMEDLGYLDDPADRLGMLDGQRMRAARVVLDIGVHLGLTRPDGAGPWTAEYAFEFMRRHVNMDDAFVQFEVNRYLGWPGQAPSYKVGQRIWEDLREEQRRRLGSDFDLKRFHSDALNLGGVGLDTLREELTA